MSVYFITCRAVDMVKIGYAAGSYHVRQRLIGMRVGCPLDIALELELPGGLAEEQALHRALKEYHVRGEWFWLAEVIERLILCPPMSAAEILESQLDQHERLEHFETEQWLLGRKSASIIKRNAEEKRKRLLRELAELEAA